MGGRPSNELDILLPKGLTTGTEVVQETEGRSGFEVEGVEDTVVLESSGRYSIFVKKNLHTFLDC